MRRKATADPSARKARAGVRDDTFRLSGGAAKKRHYGEWRSRERRAPGLGALTRLLCGLSALVASRSAGRCAIYGLVIGPKGSEDCAAQETERCAESNWDGLAAISNAGIIVGRCPCAYCGAKPGAHAGPD